MFYRLIAPVDVDELLAEVVFLELWQLAVWQQLIVFLVPYVLISYDVLGEAWEGIMERDPFNEDFLMSVATIGALLIGFIPGAETQFPEAVFVMLFFKLIKSSISFSVSSQSSKPSYQCPIVL